MRKRRNASGRMGPRAELRMTSIHEAGHVVAAMELGVDFDVVSIVPREDDSGNVGVEGDYGFWIPPGTDSRSPENERAFREWAERQAIIDYAGQAAVVVLLGMGDMSYLSAARHGAGRDYGKASRRLGRNHRRIAAAREHAVDIVSARKAHVRTIARGLLKYRSLDSQRIDWLLLSGPDLPDRFCELGLKAER